LTNDFDGGSSPNKGNRKIRSFLPRLGALLLCWLMFGSIPALRAQSDDRPNRKLLQAEKPEYPKLLKSLAIGGVVRLNVRVLANGSVSQITVLGGNPVLAESGMRAVMTWKYAPAAGVTNEIVILNFKGH
jgi:TonB family protein